MKNILRALLINCALAFPVPIMHWAFDPQVSLARLWIQFLYSLIYANCIGTVMFLLMPWTWERSCSLGFASRWLLRGFEILAGTTVGCGLAAFCVVWLNHWHDSYWDEFRYSYVIAILLTTVAVSFVASYETYRERLQVTEGQLKSKELERERALKVATEARLASLESRVHPHFLFNTINSISSLIPEDPSRAERLLTQMAGLLRFSLDSTQTGFVSLGQEIKIVQDYLEIEAARFGERLRYTVEVAEHFLAVPIPPLSLQTLVENSIKYAVSPRRRGAAIKVFAQLAEDALCLSVWDDGPGFGDVQLPRGHGLDNLEERLRALFGPEASVVIESSATETKVSFKLPVSSVVHSADTKDLVART